MHVREQYTHDAWAELKTENGRRTIPLPAALRDLLKARYAALNGNVVQLRAHEDQRTVFSAPKGGGPIDYQNWRMRRCVPLLVATAPDAEHPKRGPVTGTPHMLRHSYATALIQLGANAKTVQTVMGHHRAALRFEW